MLNYVNKKSVSPVNDRSFDRKGIDRRNARIAGNPSVFDDSASVFVKPELWNGFADYKRKRSVNMIT